MSDRTAEPVLPLPTLTLRPSGLSTRSAKTTWLGHSQVHSDDEGETYLIIPCQYMEVSIGFGEDTEDLERLVKMLQERITEIKEREA